MFAYDKHDSTFTCEFCHELHLTILFSVFYKNLMICLKEGEVQWKMFSNFLTLGLSSSFFCQPFA